MRYFGLVCFFVVLMVNPCLASDDYAYSKEWLALMHYKSNVFGSYKSTIESESFFVSKNGRTNPKEELQANIDLFNSTDYVRMCYFPARYLTLQKQGLIKHNYDIACDEFEEFKNDLSPRGITLLFTDAYMNNPSSLFGHTLLRVDTKKKGTQLLAHGVNYGAFVDEKTANPVFFAVLGLTGGYYGGFTVKPYYDVINLYNNIENRDIWEYELNFNDYEVSMFVAHLWELGNTQTSYYFFTRNCSYMLLELLDAVRPELELADAFPFSTIPIDTLKEINKREGFVKSHSYRPSRQMKISSEYKRMNNKEKDVFLDIVKKNKYDFSELNQDEKARVVETAYQYVQYQNVEGKIDRKDYRVKSFRLLRERKDVAHTVVYGENIKEENPVKTHDSMQATMQSGFRNGEAFQEISYRPAYHSLVDNNYGYLGGAEINFLNLKARHYDRSDKYVISGLDLVGIRSISPINSIFQPISYNINLNINREMDPKNEKEGYVANLKLGAGSSAEILESVYIYSMLNGYFAYGGFIDRNQWSGVAPSIGIFASFGDFRLVADAEALFATSKFASKFRYTGEALYSFSRNASIGVSYLYYDNYGHDVDEVKFGLKYHF